MNEGNKIYDLSFRELVELSILLTERGVKFSARPAMGLWVIAISGV